MPEKKNNHSRNKKNTTNNNSSKSTKGSNNYLKNANSGVESLSTKIYTSSMKEIKPLPIKLGEIKEMDSVVFESTGRNRNQEEQNKNTRKNSDENSNNLIRKEMNDDSRGSKSKFPPGNKKNIKSSFFNNDEMKEDEKEVEKNEINKTKKKK
jgi:hypothetical protein